MVRDMTAGSPMKLIVGFAVPIFLGNLFQQLYSVADAMVLGRALGGWTEPRGPQCCSRA